MSDGTGRAAIPHAALVIKDGIIAYVGPADDAPHLMVVDDDRRIRQLLSRFLQNEGYRVTVACIMAVESYRALWPGHTLDRYHPFAKLNSRIEADRKRFDSIMATNLAKQSALCPALSD